MKSLQELFLKNGDATKDFLKSPRQKYLDEIVRLVNRDRILASYKPLATRVYAIKVAHLNETDLDFLVKKMRASLYPGKVFWGSLKVKP